MWHTPYIRVYILVGKKSSECLLPQKEEKEKVFDNSHNERQNSSENIIRWRRIQLVIVIIKNFRLFFDVILTSND